MPHDRQQDSNPEGNDMTQQSGYTPASEMAQGGSTLRDRETYTQRAREESQRLRDTRDYERTPGYNEQVSGQQVYGRQYDDQQQGEFKDKARQYRDQAIDQADAGLDKAAEGMQSAADTVRQRAQERGGMTADAGAKVADTMERSADYLREHDTQEVFDDLERYVRQHPMQAVAGAIVGGFILGRLLG
jgi:ElaB/YqjD/DUF883 family membrane-anchored ribosome-binding protein